jgi:hypothetical protein
MKSRAAHKHQQAEDTQKLLLKTQAMCSYDVKLLPAKDAKQYRLLPKTPESRRYKEAAPKSANR